MALCAHYVNGMTNRELLDFVIFPLCKQFGVERQQFGAPAIGVNVIVGFGVTDDLGCAALGPFKEWDGAAMRMVIGLLVHIIDRIGQTIAVEGEDAIRLLPCKAGRLGNRGLKRAEELLFT